MMTFRGRIQGHLLDFKREWQSAVEHHPRLVGTVVGFLTFCAAFSLILSIWFLSSLWRGLPDQSAIGRIGVMNEATTIYNASDKPAK